MEQISVIARRLKSGCVQYGWSSGDRMEIARRLFRYYQLPERVSCLFDIGKVRGCRSEREIFDKRPTAGNAFFYEERDGCWYDVLYRLSSRHRWNCFYMKRIGKGAGLQNVYDSSKKG